MSIRNLFYQFLILWVCVNPCFSFAQNSPQEKVGQDKVSAPLTLADCYQLALKQSEIIAIDKDLIKETEARFLQALGAILPQVSFAITQERQDASSSSSPRNAYERKFVFTQDLFSGFKEFSAMAGSKLEHSQRTNETLRAEQLLFVDVSDAFYLLMEEREDLKTLQLVSKALIDRIIYLREREKLGKSRRSEVVNTETELYGVKAEIELVKSQEVVARQLLEFLTGVNIGLVTDMDIAYPNLSPETAYLAKASQRSDVQAAEQGWQAAKKNVDIEKSGFLPTVSFQGQYYTARNTAPSDSSWDALLSVNIPIFEGTVTYGKVQEATLKAAESQLLFQRNKRTAVTDIRQSYVKIKDAILRSKALQRALKAAEMNYYLQKKDYQYNLVNNLDVLAAIQALENSRRNYIHSFYETKRAYRQLCVASGEIPLEK